MATDFSPSSEFRYSYQVFLSFRGEDTRKTFTDHLYTALIQSGIRTFRDDDEIERGKKLDSELRKAIQQSRIAVIIFSKNYASSTWCLNEVLMILEWSKLGGNEILPVFYDVDPSEVRKQKGSIGEAFAIFEEEFIHNHEIDDEKKDEWNKKLQDWRVALQKVADITGMVLKNHEDGYEAKFIQEIVDVIERKLNRTILSVPPHLVQIKYEVESIDSWVNDSTSSAQILVICGMGGIGKSTIAKYVYNMNFHKFEASSFLALVKEECERSNGLVKLQMQLLSNILKGTKAEIYNVDEGTIKINEAICCKKVLVVIDDVDETEYLDALLGTREFYPGSKIIITTRKASLLKVHQVHKLHTVQKLYPDESLELFARHAFGKEHPENDYLEQSEWIVHYCEGLPLALKILGSSLAGKSIEVWESTLRKLESIPQSNILKILKTSFDSLQDDHDKNLFLHIACFFIRHDKDETVEILDACGFFTVCGIQNLIERCLVFIEDNNLMMHRLIQEMGQQIVDLESPNDPGKRSRLWRPKDSFDVLKRKRGTEAICGIVLDMKNLPLDQGVSSRRSYFNFLSSETSTEVGFSYDAFSRMEGLRFLKLNNATFSGFPKNFPEGLRCLICHGFPLKCIPFEFPLGNLVLLDMSYSKLEYIWIGNKVLLSLKTLNLSHSLRLIKTPNFKGLPNLEKLILTSCESLVEVDDTIGELEKLIILNLENCKSLRKFPNIGILNKSIRSLICGGCVRINCDLTTFKEKMTMGYTYFHSWLSKPIIENPKDRSYLSRSLVSLNFSKCKLSDNNFPMDFSRLSSLRHLDLSNNLFHNLPESICNLRKLSSLLLSSCEELRFAPVLQNVSYMDLDWCRSLEKVTRHSILTKPDICLFGCNKVREIQDMFKLEPMNEVSKEITDILGLTNAKLLRNFHLKFSSGYTRILNIEENTSQGYIPFLAIYLYSLTLICFIRIRYNQYIYSARRDSKLVQ